jgi:hypothetical protein
VTCDQHDQPGVGRVKHQIDQVESKWRGATCQVVPVEREKVCIPRGMFQPKPASTM